MNRLLRYFLIALTLCLPSLRAQDTLFEYQNYNHGYCPTCACAPCQCGQVPNTGPYPDAPPPDYVPDACSTCPDKSCGKECGISACAIGVVVASVAAAAVIIISSSFSHS